MPLEIDYRAMPEGREKYAAYLASRDWAVIKAKVWGRSGGTCERCKHDIALDVHHQTYARKYHERLSDLLHVCRACHQFVSGLTDEDPVEYWRSMEPKPAYRFVTVIHGTYRTGIECPKCRGTGGNNVHTGDVVSSSCGQSDYLTLHFTCECGCVFQWTIEDRKGFAFIGHTVDESEDCNDPLSIKRELNDATRQCIEHSRRVEAETKLGPLEISNTSRCENQDVIPSKRRSGKIK